jgi:flagellar basal body-associated protein FliL
MLSSFSFPSFLAILVIIIVTVFVGWSSVAFFSEGQKETASIKITSPTNGQNISNGSNLTISGIATGTNTTNHSTGNSKDGNRCYVSVIVNNIKPYQNATADGLKGVDDYSKWYYVLSTKSAAIKDGQNKLTGKLSCLLEGNSNTNSTIVNNTPNNMVKWYSINVTGISTPMSSTVNRNNQTITNSTIYRPQQPQGNTTITPNNSTSNSTSQNLKKENNSNKIATSEGSLRAKLTQSPPTSKSTPNNNYNNNNAKPLSVSIQSSQNIVNGRGTSKITAIAYDAATGKKINNAIVKLKIAFTSNGTSKEIEGHSGEVRYTANIKPNSKSSSNIKGTVLASAPGYISTTKTSSSFASTSTMTSKSNQSIINNNGSDYLTQNILKNVQRELKQNGIDIALGK